MRGDFENAFAEAHFVCELNFVDPRAVPLVDGVRNTLVGRTYPEILATRNRNAVTGENYLMRNSALTLTRPSLRTRDTE
jgi:hypothetical protein